MAVRPPRPYTLHPTPYTLKTRFVVYSVGKRCSYSVTEQPAGKILGEEIVRNRPLFGRWQGLTVEQIAAALGLTVEQVDQQASE